MKKLAIVLTLVILALAATTSWAWAGYIFQDPIFRINGETVSVAINSDVPNGQTVSRQTNVTLVYPKNVTADVVDPFDCDVSLLKMPRVEAPICVIAVRVPRTDRLRSYPVEVTLTDESGTTVRATGMAGQMIYLRYEVPEE
jgi:hypothetical protein